MRQSNGRSPQLREWSVYIVLSTDCHWTSLYIYLHIIKKNLGSVQAQCGTDREIIVPLIKDKQLLFTLYEIS